MSNSSLISYTRLSPNRYSPRKYSISRTSIHCMAGNLSVETCGNVFANRSRQASSNYGIGSDGRMALYVNESDGSWCTSSYDNDNRAITIEVANDGGAPDWHVSDKALESLINLIVDICKRNGKTKVLWFADKDKSLAYKPADNEMVLTVHRWFANKACPGDYLYNKHYYIAEQVNKKLSGYIKGICQMPTDDGYLLGMETYENDDYSYEILIYDCSAQAWCATSGKCKVADKSLWWLWQPQYGYYWTLFRVYDKDDNILDEECYGFENI